MRQAGLGTNIGREEVQATRKLSLLSVCVMRDGVFLDGWHTTTRVDDEAVFHVALTTAAVTAV